MAHDPITGRFIKGSHLSDEERKKIAIGHTGLKKTLETKLKLSQKRFGEKNPFWGKIHTIETINKIVSKTRGQKRSDEFRKNQSGENNQNWKNGVNRLSDLIRRLRNYREWRSDVFERDNFICQKCGGKEKLHAHHIKEMKFILREYSIKSTIEAIDCSELWNINNGITLCKKCHEIIHNRLMP